MINHLVTVSLSVAIFRWAHWQLSRWFWGPVEFKHLINSKARDWKQDVFVNVHLLCMFGCSHGSTPRESPQSPHSSGPIGNGYGVEPPVPAVQLVPLAPGTRIIILTMLCREHSPTLLQKWAQLPHVCVESVWGWRYTCHHLWGDSSHLSHSPAAEAEDFSDFNLRLQEGHGNISFYQSSIPRFHCVLNSLLLIQEGNPAWSLSPCKVFPMWKEPW